MLQYTVLFHVASSVPEVLIPVFVLITLLGDAVLLFAVLSVLYWLAPESISDARRIAITIVGLAVAALAVTLTIKSVTAVPRPPTVPEAPLWLPEFATTLIRSETAIDGYGFPSGHAIAATVFYGGFALLLRVWTRRRRWLAAGAFIFAVGLSRVVIQVHNPIDVVAGIGLGVVLLVFTAQFVLQPDRSLSPMPLFILAGAIAVAGLVVSTSQGHPREATQAAVSIGTALGGVLVWMRYGTQAVFAPPLRLRELAIVLPLTGGLWITAYSVSLPIVVTIFLSAAAIGCIILAPLFAGWVQKNPVSSNVDA